MNKKNTEVFTDGDEITTSKIQPPAVTIQKGKDKDHSGTISLLDNEQTQLLHYLLNNLLVHYKLDVAEVYLKDINSNTLTKVVHSGNVVKSLWKTHSFSWGEGCIGQTALQSSNKVFKAANLQGLSAAVPANTIQRIACIPLKENEGQVIGVLSLAASRQTAFNKKELESLNIDAMLLGVLLARENLHTLRQNTAILNERERIGMDLHDGIIQGLYAMGLNLQSIRLQLSADHSDAKSRLTDALQTLDDSIRNIRAYILDLRPRKLEDENLLQGMRALVREFRANTQVDVVLEGEERDLQGLTQANAMALFHIFQEALANIAKHARASRVTVRLWIANDRVMLRVNDDGLGFDPSKVDQHLGHGLANMQTRAQNAAGGIEIISIRKQGTTVLAWVPILSSERKPG
jgi:signal transduction histidine kinase